MGLVKHITDWIKRYKPEDFERSIVNELHQELQATRSTDDLLALTEKYRKSDSLSKKVKDMLETWQRHTVKILQDLPTAKTNTEKSKYQLAKFIFATLNNNDAQINEHFLSLLQPLKNGDELDNMFEFLYSLKDAPFPDSPRQGSFFKEIPHEGDLGHVLQLLCNNSAYLADPKNQSSQEKDLAEKANVLLQELLQLHKTITPKEEIKENSFNKCSIQ